MDEYRLVRWVLMARKTDVRLDGVNVALGNRGMMVEAACQCAKDKKSGEPWYICI